MVGGDSRGGWRQVGIGGDGMVGGGGTVWTAGTLGVGGDGM